MEPRPGANTHVHESYPQKRVAKCTWNHVQVPAPPSTGRTHGKERLLGRGFKSMSLHTRAQVEHTVKSGYWHVDSHPGAYTHVLCSNPRERAAAGPWIHVQGPRPSCTGRTREKLRLQARRFTSRNLQPRERVKHTKKCGCRRVDPSPRAYTQVEHTEKLGYRHVDPRPVAYTRVHRSNTRKRAATGTWIYVQELTPTCTGGPHGKGRLQARGSMSSGQDPRAQVKHTKKGGHRHVDPRAGAYTLVNRSNTRKKAAKGTWNHVQGPKPSCTGRTRPGAYNIMNR